MNEPLVSVVIPFYSEVDWLSDAIKSVNEQIYKNIEIIIINDGSKEEITQISSINEQNIKIIYKENGGPASARNKGIEEAKGKYVAFLDSDDLWHEEKLAKQIRYMESNNCIWSQHSYEMFWEDSTNKKVVDTSVYSGNVFKDCFISFKIQTSCVVVLREILIKNNIRFPISKRYGQDGDFYRQLAKEYPIGYVDGILSRFRIRGTNAGFRARVQLDDKASTWNEIKSNYDVINLLPRPVIFAYKLASINSNIANLVNKKITNYNNIAELISKVMYLVPYSIFKVYSKNTRAVN